MFVYLIFKAKMVKTLWVQPLKYKYMVVFLDFYDIKLSVFEF